VRDGKNAGDLSATRSTTTRWCRLDGGPQAEKLYSRQHGAGARRGGTLAVREMTYEGGQGVHMIVQLRGKG